MITFLTRWLKKFVPDNDGKAEEKEQVNYLTIFTPHNLAMLSDWLAESGELYVDVYHRRSGGGSSGYFIRSMADLKSLIAQDKWHPIDYTIFREQQFTLRGIADDQLLVQVFHMIPDGQPYAFVLLEASIFPDHVAYWGHGRSHDEFRREYSEVLGEEIAIGKDPHIYLFGKDRIDLHPDKVFKATFLRQIGEITRNQDSYLPFENEPEKYKWVIDLWQSND
jgi:hypothetical protein